MKVITKQRIQEVQRLTQSCKNVGIDYNKFIAACRVIHKEKHLSLSLLNKAQTALAHIIDYGTQRIKVLGLQDLVALQIHDEDFLAKGFRYAVSKEEKVDNQIKQFVSFCNIQLDMFDLKDMEELAKDIASKMQLGVKSSDSDYFSKVCSALPQYLKGNLPPKHNKAIDFFKSFAGDIGKHLFDEPDLSKAQKQCYPDARACYTDDPETFSLEFFLRQHDTPKVLDTLDDVVFVQQLDHYLVCLHDGRVLHDALTTAMFLTLRKMGSRAEWIAERLSMNVKEYIDLGLTTSDSNTEEQSATVVKIMATAGLMAELIEKYRIWDLSDDCKAKQPGTGIIMEADARYGLYNRGELVKAFSTPQDALNEFHTIMADVYGQPVDTSSNLGAIFITPNGTFLVVSEDGTIYLATKDAEEATAFVTDLRNGVVTKEYIMERLIDDYRTNDERTLLDVLYSVSKKYPHKKWPADNLQKLFAITPLVADSVDNF